MNEAETPETEGAPVRVLRGRGATLAADREATSAALTRAAQRGEVTVRAWTPHRHVAFGRRDRREAGYERARRAASERGYETVERDVGGRAVAYTGRTVAFAHARPAADPRGGVDARYERATATLAEALASVGATVTAGEPPESFCPGAHSLRAPDGGKVAGIAQRVRAGAALVAGVVVVADRGDQREVLAPVYDALGVPFDPASVGSVAAAGGASGPDRVARAVEAALVDGRATRVERV